MLTHVVVKTFDTDRPMARGEKVDARGWVNLKALVEQGYLQPLEGVARDSGSHADTHALLSEVLERLDKLERLVKGGTPDPLPHTTEIGGEQLARSIDAMAAQASAPARTKGVRPRRRKAARRRKAGHAATTAAPAQPEDSAAKE